MPRPKKTDESRRRFHVTIRLNEAEYAKACRESDEIGVTLSDYLRAKLMKGFIRIPKYAKIDTEAINALSKLGGLFKKTHTESGGLYSQQTAEILGEIYTIVQELRCRVEEEKE